MKPSIETLLANVVSTQSAFEAAKNALFLARLDAERAAQWTEAEAREFGDFRSNEEVAAAYPRRTLWSNEEGRA
tara:strand:+ start:502 stop:723 length:222 start_codon:yes stop_codon:yes gene_type:complete